MNKVFQFAIIPLVCAASTVLGQVQYTVTDLGTLPGDNMSVATSINNNGQIVGGASNYYYPVNAAGPVISNGHAFMYSGGSMTDLGSLGAMQTEAYGINNNGQIVGGPFNTILSGRAFIYSNGAMQDLGTPGGSWASAYCINNNGQVTGWYDGPGGQRAFLASGGTTQDLGTAQGWNWSAAYGINDNGTVVGQGGNTNIISAGSHAFLYSGGIMQNLGNSLGGIDSQALAVNDSDQVVGWADSTGGQNEAFLYSNGTMFALNPFDGGSIANGINNAGQVVGEAGLFTDDSYAFLYNDGAMLNLNGLIPPSSGWQLTEATAINDNGWIVGQGANPSGQNDAFLLTPTPEPDTLALLAVGTIALVAF
jgi:probable HAF family extracellular repeat protein